MNFEGGHHWKFIRSIGVLLGLWPYRCTILHKINGAIAVTIIILCMVAQLAVFLTHEVSMDLCLQIVNGIIPPTVAVVKYFTIMYHMDQVMYIFVWIQSDHDSLTNEKELRLLEKSVDRGTYIFNIIWYFSPGLFVFIGFPLLPVIFNAGESVNQSRSALIPIIVEYFVDQDRYFSCIMFHFNITIVLVLGILIVTESMVIYFTTHACGLLEVTGERVERVLENSILNYLPGKTSLSIHDQLVATIQLHQRVLKLIEYLNTIFIPHYCILIALGVVSISMNLYFLVRGILLRKTTAELINSLFTVLAEFFYLGCGNYVGQVMLDKGQELFTKTYCARWHAAPLPVQKMLLYIQQRSILPTAYVFGGIYTVSLELFSKLVNTSMSYFTVLYSTA